MVACYSHRLVFDMLVGGVFTFKSFQHRWDTWQKQKSLDVNAPKTCIQRVINQRAAMVQMTVIPHISERQQHELTSLVGSEAGQKYLWCLLSIAGQLTIPAVAC